MQISSSAVVKNIVNDHVIQRPNNDDGKGNQKICW